MKLYVVKYTGPFGFIKPWTAVRDEETYSQQFLTPSIVAGIERKLFPTLLKDDNGEIKKIVRHRLNYCGLTSQQEKTWSKGGFKKEKKKDSLGREYFKAKNIGIINRAVMLNPELHLAFTTKLDAENAFMQNICLCRNEDILLPMGLTEMDEEEFEQIDGFELTFTEEINGFKVGHNRFKDAEEMFGKLQVFGNPIRN
jgi:hypothetical protein